MIWEKKISELDSVELKRLRHSTSRYSIPRHKEIPFDAALPQHTGKARMFYPEDYLYVIGKTKSGRVKKICCGHFSQELLNTVKQKINSEPGHGPYGENAG